MDAMCQISKGDVRACVEHMKQNNVTGNIFQVGNAKYHTLDKNRGQVNATVQKRDFTHVIGMDNCTLHTLKCGRVKGATIKASIVPNHEIDTGLTLCRCVKGVIARRK